MRARGHKGRAQGEAGIVSDMACLRVIVHDAPKALLKNQLLLRTISKCIAAQQTTGTSLSRAVDVSTIARVGVTNETPPWVSAGYIYMPIQVASAKRNCFGSGF